MTMNPLNLALRFALEVIALIAIGVWGYSLVDSPLRYVLAIGIPIVTAAVWGIFNVPGDPSRSGSAPIRVSGPIRLLVEWLVLAFGAFALVSTGHVEAGSVFVLVVVIHYLLSLGRMRWLLSVDQNPSS